MNCEKVTNFIEAWLIEKLDAAKYEGFVIGVSGGVDSGLVSTLCARTGRPVAVVSLPINQAKDQITRARQHIDWLTKKFPNVQGFDIDLTDTNNALLQATIPVKSNDLAKANQRCRLRMVTLYIVSNTYRYLVAGTGNKIEDFGVGFFCKGGDGVVDLSPIGDLLKSEVRELSSYLGVDNSIVKALSTDGLWGDNRSDEAQIGATYNELEWALEAVENGLRASVMTPRQVEVLNIYLTMHKTSRHKMAMPPICEVSKTLKEVL